MKKDSISAGLMKMPWADLAGILVTKDELREAGWSEAKIKLHLGQPHGRHPSTHFRNPLGQPYWTGQRVVAAAVRGRTRGQAAPREVTRLKVAEGREFRSA
jgi:hypothetical protein